ncbi:MAG: hypothetical protein IIB56_16880 [Planctomycetes bacterium]|nr:hypothetical protein [Planctomycetota bacterium]
MNDALLYPYLVIGGRKFRLMGKLPGLGPWGHSRTAPQQSAQKQNSEEAHGNR